MDTVDNDSLYRLTPGPQQQTFADIPPPGWEQVLLKLGELTRSMVALNSSVEKMGEDAASTRQRLEVLEGSAIPQSKTRTGKKPYTVPQRRPQESKNRAVRGKAHGYTLQSTPSDGTSGTVRASFVKRLTPSSTHTRKTLSSQKRKRSAFRGSRSNFQLRVVAPQPLSALTLMVVPGVPGTVPWSSYS